MDKMMKVSLRSIGTNSFKVDDALHMVTGFGLTTYTLVPADGNDWILSAMSEGKQLSMSLSSDGTVEVSFTLKSAKLESAVEDTALKVSAYVTLTKSVWIQQFLSSGTMTGYRINSYLNSENGAIRFFAKVPCTIVNVEREEWLPSDR